MLWKMGFSAAKIAPYPPYTPLGTIKVREGFAPLELSCFFGIRKGRLRISGVCPQYVIEFFSAAERRDRGRLCILRRAKSPVFRNKRRGAVLFSAESSRRYSLPSLRAYSPADSIKRAPAPPAPIPETKLWMYSAGASSVQRSSSSFRMAAHAISSAGTMASAKMRPCTAHPCSIPADRHGRIP